MKVVEIVQAPAPTRAIYDLAGGFLGCRPPPDIFPDGRPTEADRRLALELWRALDPASRTWYAVLGIKSVSCNFFLVPVTIDDLAALELPERILAFYGHAKFGSPMTTVFIEPCADDVMFQRYPHTGQWRAPRPIFVSDTPTESDRALALAMWNLLDRTSKCWYAKSLPPGFTDIPLPPEELAALNVEVAAMPDERLNPEYRYYRG